MTGTTVGDHEPDADHALGDRLLDLLVFAPAGAMLSLVEEFPRLAERGRERLGVRISSARAVGHFVVTAGGHELKRRSARVVGGGGVAPTGPSPGDGGTPPRTAPADRGEVPLRGRSPGAATAPSTPGRTPPAAAPAPPAGGTVPVPGAGRPVPGPVRLTGTRPDEDHTPAVDSLAIPGFDSLSASQVVQRLDGLNRQELVSVRAYELATRGRRTILSRVDQLLEARA